MSDDKLAAIAASLRSEDAEERRRAIAEMPGGWVPGALELLVRALGDDNWRVRKEAVQRVARWPDADAAVKALIEIVRDTSEVGSRNAALDALAHVGRPAVAPLLGEVAAGGEHRKFLVDALGAIGEAEAVPLLVRLVDDDDPNLRVAAAEALRHIGGADAKAALRGLLDTDHLPLRLAALEGLSILQAAVPVAEVRPALEDTVLRKAALRLLGWSRDPAAVPHLVDAMRQDRRSLHAAAVVALATLLATADDERDEMDRLAAALGDEARANVLAVFATDDSELRRAAAAVLGAAGAVEFAESLAAGISDPSVADACAAALAEMGPEATEAILSAAAGADPELAADLYDLIADLGFGGDEVERALRDALDHDDELVGAAAARALGAVGGAGGGEWLAGALADGSRPDVAAGAATGLGRLAGRGFADGVRAALRDSGLSAAEPEVRAAAALALAEARADDSATLDLLAAQLTDDDPYPRLAAIRALGALGEAGHALLSARLAAEDDAEMADAIRAVLGDEGPTGG